MQLLRFCQALERLAAYAQGKGYGAGSVKQEVAQVLKMLGHKPSLAIDIGGNKGNYTAELRKRCSTVEIHIFEPAASNVKILRQRFDSDPLIKIVPLAVADNDGRGVLYTDKHGSGLASLTKRRLDHFGIDFGLTETVDVIRFESYWDRHLNRRPIDIVKLDIEGHELMALNGFGGALDHVRVVQFEFGGCNIDTRTYFQDFWYLFENLGFTLYRIGPLGLQKIHSYNEACEHFVTTNYIAAKVS